MSKFFKRTKILATIGPAVDSKEKIEKLIMAGVSGCRFNCSHGSDEERARQLKWVRKAAQSKGHSIATVIDLPGPKIRLGELQENHFAVKKGDKITLDFKLKKHDGSAKLPVQYNLATNCKPMEPVFLCDGTIKAHIAKIISKTAIELEVENDGILMSNKGINLPSTDFQGNIFTEKDVAEIEFAAKQDYDYVAMSFVHDAEDIRTLRQLLLANDSSAQIIAKIETKAAVASLKHLEEIVMEADGVIVARGDLAVEAGAEAVPIIQRRLIALCREHSKICIVATQMMSSMVEKSEPTRAEVSDVASAVIQGADAVMLSDETTIGKYPIETVKAMRKVILYTQNNSHVALLPNQYDGMIRNLAGLKDYNALAFAAVRLAENIHADIIVCQSASGATSAAVAAQRPNIPIITVTMNPQVANQLALEYGTAAFVRPYAHAAGLKLAQDLKAKKYLHRRDGSIGELLTVIVSGDRTTVGTTDTIKVRHI